VKVRKECVDKFLSFISEKLRRDTIVLISTEVQSIAQSHARSVQAG
jgi:hypothetical protein